MKRSRNLNGRLLTASLAASSMMMACSENANLSRSHAVVTDDDGLSGTHLYAVVNGRLERTSCVAGFTTPAMCQTDRQSIAYKGFQVAFVRAYGKSVPLELRQRFFKLIESRPVGRAMKSEPALPEFRDLLPKMTNAFDEVARMSPDGMFEVAGGLHHTCGIRSDGNTYCWGSNGRFQLGLGIANDQRKLNPERLKDDHVFTQIVAGDLHTCGLDIEGRAFCWGQGDYGQLGHGYHSSWWLPRPVQGDLRFSTISAGGWHTCGLTDSGDTYCWGENRYGQLGTGDTTNQNKPVAVSSDVKFAQISAGDKTTCALDMNGAAFCWGSGWALGAGGSDAPNLLLPTRVDGGITFTHLSAGELGVCGLDRDGRAYCWGDGLGHLGNGTYDNHPVPFPVSGTARFVDLVSTMSRARAITREGVMYSWGVRWLNGHIQSNQEPTAIATDITFKQVAKTQGAECALDEKGRPYCYGLNPDGRLGTGDTLDRDEPTPVKFLD